ncbi:TPA: fimbrial protein [Enterobacter hormaechei]
MNKKIIVRMIVGALMMGTSAASMAAANAVGSNSATINGSVVSPTCTVTSWPTDITFDPVSVADFANATHNSQLQVKPQGQFTLTNCPAQKQMKYTVRSVKQAQGNPYQALVQTADGREVSGFALSFSTLESFTVPWTLNGAEATLGTTDDQGNLNVPAFAALVKRGGASTPTVDGNPWSGNFSTVINYTVSYD